MAGEDQRQAAAAVAAALSPEGPATAIGRASAGDELGPALEAVRKVAGEGGSWVIEVAGAGLAEAAPIAKSVFWSPLRPGSIFATSEAVEDSADAVVIARDGRVGGPPPAAEEQAEIEKALRREVRLLKAEEAEERFVLGIVLEPDVVDTQGDTYDSVEVRKAAHGFMEHYRQLGKQHSEIVTGKLRILESYVAPADFEAGGQKVSKGTWVMGIRVADDDLWESVKKGDYTGFSIGGSAYRRPKKKPDSQS